MKPYYIINLNVTDSSSDIHENPHDNRMEFFNLAYNLNIPPYSKVNNFGD